MRHAAVTASVKGAFRLITQQFVIHAFTVRKPLLHVLQAEGIRTVFDRVKAGGQVPHGSGQIDLEISFADPCFFTMILAKASFIRSSASCRL